MRQVGKVLTVEELNQKIDKIEKIIDEIREKKSKLVYYKPNLPKKEIREIVLRKDVDLKAVDRQLEFSNAIKKLIDEGGMLKDLEEGYVDFRWRKGRKRTYLCWKYGEKEVKYWHGLKGGCKKRRPLK